MDCINKIHINSKGQAVTEYILVLIVLLFIFLLLLQFNREFREWGEQSFVAYYRCLLETGEVPNLGGPNEAGVQCVGEFQPFAYRAEWQPVGDGGESGGGGSGGDGSSGGSDGSGGSGQTGNENATNESAGSSRRGGEVSRSAGGSSGRGADRFGSRMGGLSGTDAGASGSDKNKKGIYTGSNETTNFNTRGTERSVTKRGEQIDYGWGMVRKQEDRGEERSVASVKKEETKVQEQKRMKVVRDRIEVKTEAEDEGFTIGGFFRILIIAAIIIALGVLIGGQLLQITKGVDAEG